MQKIIDGRKLALKHGQKLSEKIKKLGLHPKMVSILIGDDPASVKFTIMKQRKALELGIDFEVKSLKEDVDFNKVISEIKALNSNSNIHGIMVQLPIPKQFLGEHNDLELLRQIAPEKDVDGLSSKKFLPATVRGVFSILKHKKINVRKTIFAVVGSEGFIGKGLVKVLIQKGARVIRVDKKLPGTNLRDIKQAQVVISCTGVAELVKPEHIAEGAILIDVGLGDFDPATYTKASYYTPKVGGVGPMTVISLMENIIEASVISTNTSF